MARIHSELWSVRSAQPLVRGEKVRVMESIGWFYM